TAYTPKKVCPSRSGWSVHDVKHAILFYPCRTSATLLNNFKNGVHAYKTVRENRRAMIIRIARQLVLVDPSPAIYCITILIDRGIEDHGSSDLGAIGSGGR